MTAAVLTSNSSSLEPFLSTVSAPPSASTTSRISRLLFRSSVSDYMEAFQATMAHAGYLTLEQSVQLFTGGLPEAIRVNVEL
jgi:hypothetical protein